jgi:hypothetical protein
MAIRTFPVTGHFAASIGELKAPSIKLYNLKL